MIGYIAKTFVTLCEIGDFESTKTSPPLPSKKEEEKDKNDKGIDNKVDKKIITKKISIDALQYHINIVLPESKDQAVYDAIFKALREHLE